LIKVVIFSEDGGFRFAEYDLPDVALPRVREVLKDVCDEFEEVLNVED